MAEKLQTLTRYLNAWLPPLVWANIIFFLSDQRVLPQFETSGLEFFTKKLAHLTVYAILYLLFFRATTIKSPLIRNKKIQLLIPLVLCLIYAISDELHQSLVPGRYATIRDVGFDMLGVASAFFWKHGYI